MLLYSVQTSSLCWSTLGGEYSVELLLYKNCCCTRYVAVQELLLYKKCCCTRTVVVHELLLYKNCCCTRTVAVQELLLYKNFCCTRTVIRLGQCLHLSVTALELLRRERMEGISWYLSLWSTACLLVLM